jgi:hypothetical protein
MLIARMISVITLTIALTACSLTRASETTAIPPTAAPAIQSTPVPTLSRDRHTVEAPTATPTQAATATSCSYTQDSAVTSQQVVRAEMDYQARVVNVQQRIRYRNTSGVALQDIPLHVRPNSIANVFSLQDVRIEDTTRDAVLTGTRLTVPLLEPLLDNCVVDIQLQFQIRIPPIELGTPNAYQGYLGYSERQTNLGQWLPVIAARADQDWVIHEPAPIGEQEILELVDWDVTLKVLNPHPGIILAAPGRVESIGEWEWRIQAEGTRDFSISLGENYRVETATTAGGQVVELYTFADGQMRPEGSNVTSAQFALDSAARSVELFTELFGALPYPRMVVIQSDFPDGMEFSGLVFVGGEYFRGFGGPTSYLLLITVHEIAHQWWYAQVGNDQALTPWLDEALATYSEYLFIEAVYPELKNWWWEFRVDRLLPEGFVDSTVYEFTSRRAYINAVYLRGVRMLDDLRVALGDDTFFDWLRRYVQAGSGEIATPGLFWSLLTPDMVTGTATIRERYLRAPQIITIRPTEPSS